MAGQEEIIEESPEQDSSFYYTISKYGGDVFFPAEIEPSDKLPLSRFNSEGMARSQFFDQVRGYFSTIRAGPRASRVRERQGPTYTGGSPDIAFNDQDRPFLEKLEEGLILKFRGPEFQGTVYRTKREAERKQDQKREGPVGVMSKEEMLRDLADKIDSVQWRPKSNNHKAIVAARPGISHKHQKELEDESY